ncbi:probable G-protein coupled receptor B0563.6 isoform X2 [Procambarus clarkii]|uniref:probable G-protein coupled receptor B0563.6 isoform X2 n=1 Tax=Procambarus clarkii TaxID=6728 RepID=UPI0037438226
MTFGTSRGDRLRYLPPATMKEVNNSYQEDLAYQVDEAYQEDLTYQVDEVHQVVYRQVLPVLVSLGVLANVLCIIVLSKPRLRAARVNWYFLLLAVLDLLVCVFYIPVITTITGCTFSSYVEAYYFSHLGWTLVGISQALGTYTMLWLSLDRFIAVWMCNLYPRIQSNPNIFRNRIVLTFIVCIFVHLPYIIDAKVDCSSSTKTDSTCVNGTWIIKTGYQNHFNEAWHKVYRTFYGLFIRFVPASLLVVFNVGLVIGVARGRVNFPTTAEGSRRAGERTLVITVISITASYILLTLPIIIYVMNYAKHHSDRCYGNHPKEVLRAIGNSFQILEHTIHIIFFLGLNHGFREELKILLYLAKRKREPGPWEDGQHGPSQSRHGELSLHCNTDGQKNASDTPNVSQ